MTKTTYKEKIMKFALIKELSLFLNLIFKFEFEDELTSWARPELY